MRHGIWRTVLGSAGLAIGGLVAGCASSGAADESPGSEIDALDPAFTPAWAELVRPGPAHERLARLAGTWDFTYEFWLYTGSPPETGAGVLTYESVLDGRFVRGRYELPMREGLLRGEDLMGYNAYRGRYESVWVDNHGTQVVNSTGAWDPGREAIVLNGTYDDVALDRQNRPLSNVLVFTGPNTLEIEMYGPDSADELFLQMRLRATRR